jgi:uncharacterized protein YegJ (DUF2314 family)
LFWKRKKSKFTEPQEQPLFAAVKSTDPEMREAYAAAAASLDQFVCHLKRPGSHICACKLRFRDPELSERLGEDRFVYLWLAAVEQAAADNAFVGTFIAVPKPLNPFHQAGQRHEFNGTEIFDWFVNDDGSLYGGFTMRVSRSRLPEADRADFDKYTGVKHWVVPSRS